MQSTKKRPYLAIILIASVVFAGALAASVMLPLGKIAFAKSEDFYVIYYGHLIDQKGNATEQVARILAAKPELVIVPYSFPDGELNLTSEVHKQFSDAGIKVITYTWTDYTLRDLSAVRADIDTQMASGVDGILVDEVTNILTNEEYDYYAAIYNHVKSYGHDKIVIMNPGHFKATERIMKISDIVSFEEEWVYHNQIPWITKYPPSRFMGVSSNEYCASCIDESNAAEKTLEAWSAGIGYHFTTDKYIDLPTWLESYTSQVKEEKAKQS